MAIRNILTVDLEDWFHICGVKNILPADASSRLESRVEKNTFKILEFLDTHQVSATFFILGFIADKHPSLIRAIFNAGHEIASHGYAHHRVYTQRPDEFRRDLKQSIAVISDITGTPVKGYRAPEWSIREDSRWALDILLEEGIEFDSSMAPLHIIGNPKYCRTPHILPLATGNLLEVPPMVFPTAGVNWPAGGGWGLRTLPYPWIRALIQGLNEKNQPALIFIHPREFDDSPPRITLPWIKKFVLSAGFENTDIRLRRLVKDFRFTGLSKALTV